MGRKAQAQHFQKLYRRKEARRTPRLPPALAEALKERGVDVPVERSHRRFYSQLGLQSDPNADARAQIGFSDRLGEIRRRARVDPPMEAGDPAPFVAAAESLPHGARYEKHLGDFELKAIVQLRAFYGTDLEMMSVDHRRNPLQWTVPQLKRVMAIYEREAALLATKKDEFEREGEEG
jgi:hypothetical protein